MSKILPSRLGQVGRFLFALVLTMSVLTGLGLAGQERVSAEGEVVSIDPADQAISRGETFTVDVMISGAENLWSYEFTLAFDPDLVEVQGVADGGFLGSTGRDVQPVGPDIGDGTVTFSAFTTGAMAGPDGSGTLATVTLKAIGQGTSALDLHDVSVFSGTEEREPVAENGSVDSVFAMAIDPEESIVNLVDPATFTVDVMIHGAMDLKGYEFSLDFDSDVLMATDVADAGFLQGDVTSVGPDIGDGTLTFAAFSTEATELPDGDGVLATITFDPVDYGETKLDLNELTAFSGDTEETPDDMDGMVYVVRAGVSVLPEATSVSRCDTFEVMLSLGGEAEDVTGFDIYLDWDPALFEVTDITFAPFMESTGRTAQQIAKDIDNTVGTLNYAVATVGTAEGPDAPGVLAVVEFEAVGVGTSALHLHDVLVSQSGFEVEPAALYDGTAESTKEAVGFELSDVSSPQVAGQAFDVTITAVNEDDDPAEHFAGDVTLSDTTGTLDPTVVTFVDGTAEMTVPMTITKAESDIVITAETVNLCGVTISGETNAFTVDPDVEWPDRAELTPDPETVTAGEDVEYTLTAWDRWDNEFDATAWADFSIDAGAGGGFADNVYTSELAGTWTVTGEYAGDDNTVSDTAVLTVEPGPLFEIVVLPDPAQVPVAAEQQFSATGYDEFGNEVAPPITPDWSVADPDAGSIDAAGLFTASFNIGTYEDAVVATEGAVSGDADVEVTGYRLYVPMIKEDS